MPEPTRSPSRWRRETEAIVLEAPSREELIRRIDAVLSVLRGEAPPALADLGFTLNGALEGHPARLAVVAASNSDLERKLAYAGGRLADPSCRQIKDRKGIYYFDEPLAKQARIALLFPGEGAQYPDMLADLCLQFPVVRDCFDRTDRAFAGHPRGYVPSDFIFSRNRGGDAPGSRDERLWQMDGAVEAVFTANHALLRLLEGLGVRPHAVVGHSTGEYSALIAAGCVDISRDEQLTRLMSDLNGAYQGMLQAKSIPEATLVAVGAADRATVLSALAPEKGAVEVAMDNCPHQVVLCGPDEGVSRVVEGLRGQGAVCETLPFARAYHTARFEPLCEPLRDFLARVPVQVPRVPIYSCATAAPMPADPNEIRALAVAQWAMPVRFRETIEAMYDDGIRVFVEAGPRGNLTAFVADTLRTRPHLALPANLHRRSGIEQIDHVVCLLAAHGVPLRFDVLYRNRACRRVELEARAEATPRAPGTPLVLPSSLPSLRLGAAAASASAKQGSTSTPVRPVAMRPAGDGSAAPARPAAPQPAAPAPPAAQTPSDGRAAVMAEYFRTAERFVEMQRGVLLAFLGAPARPNRKIAAETTAAMTAVATPAHAGAPGHVETTARPPAPEAPAPVAPFSVEPPTGAEGSRTLEAEPTTGGAKPAPATGREPGAVDLKEALLSVVSERTGYPTDMLGLELRLEADLGIDSIKRVEIVGALQKRLGALPADAVEGMTRLKTLSEILAYLGERTGGASAAPPRTDVETPEPGAPPPEGGDAIPLVGPILSSVPGLEVVARREIDVAEDAYLRHHTLGSGVSQDDPGLLALPLVMLTMGAEMLAQAAAHLAPGKVVVELRNVEARRWLALRTGRLGVEVKARRASANATEVVAELRETGMDPTGADTSSPPALSATVVLADAYPPAPPAPPFSLRGARASRFAPEDLYTRVMFHGASLQGVTRVDRWGEDGAEATLLALPAEGLFRSTPAPRFLTDPVLLDAAGQIVGFWTADHLRSGFVVFPYHIDSMRFFGPARPAGDHLACRARIGLDGAEHVRADFDVIGEDDRVHVSVSGWKDKRIAISEEFFRFRFSPRDVVLSRPLSLPLASGLNASDVRCCQLEFANGILEREAAIWKEGLAHLVLSEREREEWRGLKAAEARRTEWLLGRLAVKDAARLLLAERLEEPVCPADVEVRTDARGRPHLDGTWADLLDEPLVASISHSGGAAAALVVADTEFGVGLDIEPLLGRETGFSGDLDLAFTREERTLLEPLLDGENAEEWLLRFWCAKEAASKALGTGMDGDPRNLEVRSVEPQTGAMTVIARIPAPDGSERPDGTTIHVRTSRDGATIIATARGEEPIWTRLNRAPAKRRSSRSL